MLFNWKKKNSKNKFIGYGGYEKYEQQYNKEKALIEWIKANDIKVLNSGTAWKEN